MSPVTRRPALPSPTPPPVPVIELLTTAGPLVAVDLATVVGSLVLATGMIRLFGGDGQRPPLPYEAMLGTFALVLLLFGLWTSIAVNPVVEARRLAVASTVAFGACLVGVTTVAPGRVNLAGVVCAWILATVLFPAARSVARGLLGRTGWWGRSAVLVGTVEQQDSAVPGLRVQGLRPIRTTMDPADLQAWEELARSSYPCVIVFAHEPWPPALTRAQALSIPHILVVAPNLSQSIGSLWLEPVEIGGSTAFHFRNGLHSLRCRLMKRALDVGLILLFLPLLLGAGALTALLVKLSSPGPLFFGHWRLGRSGRWFKAWKFRTMTVDAEQRLREYLALNPDLKREWEDTQKLKCDPRVMPIGRLLRRTSLDELPQLWNILKGEMSLVGPRPIVENEVERYGPMYEFYEQSVPGLTGLWQISGRNNTTYSERVRLDAAYVRNWSIWMDLFILFRTVRSVLFTEGAY